ncbi:MAG: hypothetical protein QOJ06_2892 [Pseudonocardiales bacterium]|jgi:transposase IS116/IS110/IS902 family protein|nr:hypothetical protein [Pseudonocardiales bacterium]
MGCPIASSSRCNVSEIATTACLAPTNGIADNPASEAKFSTCREIVLTEFPHRAPARTTSCAPCCREYYPALLDTFTDKRGGLLRAEARALLAAATISHFDKHPDAEIITSLPGLGSLTGARVLAEIGDDRSRFTNARALKAYAGSAPVTRASGISLTVTHRRVKNQRLAAAGYVWAFSALTASPGARTHYDRRKTTGDRHTTAQRNLFNRLLGCLHHCLQTRQHYNEHIAFPTTHNTPTTAAA